jgi:soluble lytic murein transglycosylase
LRQRSRNEPQNRQAFEQIRSQPGYSYALHPLPFWDKVNQWSTQRQLNPLLVLSLMRQESRFQTQITSVAGAQGLMQLMPDTASWVAQQLGLKKYSVTEPEDNINLGTWYLDYTHKTYDNNTLLALASYNAGPANLDDWLRRDGSSPPDDFIERIPFPETQGYVKHIFENYWNYLRLYNPETVQHLKTP